MSNEIVKLSTKNLQPGDSLSKQSLNGYLYTTASQIVLCFRTADGSC